MDEPSKTTQEPLSELPTEETLAPELLVEAGRASALRDFFDRLIVAVRAMGDEARGIKDAVIASSEQSAKNWRRLAVALAVCFVLLLIGFGVSIGVNRNNSVSLKSQNITIEQLVHNQQGIDELVSFVRNLPTTSSGSSQGTSVAVKNIQTIHDLVCENFTEDNCAARETTTTTPGG